MLDILSFIKNSDPTLFYKTHENRINSLNILNYNIPEIVTIFKALNTLNNYQTTDYDKKVKDRARDETIQNIRKYNDDIFRLIETMFSDPFIDKSRRTDITITLYQNAALLLSQHLNVHSFDFYASTLAQKAFLFGPTCRERNSILHDLFFPCTYQQKPVVLGELQTWLDDISCICQQLQTETVDSLCQISNLESITQYREDAKIIASYVELFLLSIHSDDEYFDLDKMETAVDRELNVHMIVGQAKTKEDINTYFEVYKCRNKAIQIFEGLQSTVKQYIDILSSFSDQLKSVDSIIQKDIFVFRSSLPKDTFSQQAIIRKLHPMIHSCYEGTTIDSFEKLLIFSPESVTVTIADKVTRICSQRKSGSDSFFGKLDERISAIRKDFYFVPEEKISTSARIKYLLLAFLCATAAIFLTLITLEKLPIAAVIVDNLDALVSLAVTIVCLIIGFKLFHIPGLLIAYGAAELVKDLVTAKLILNLIAIAFTIGCIVFLFYALGSDSKKRKAREEYLNKVKKEIKEPMAHIHLMLKQLEKVPADIDVSGIRAYYEEAAKHLSHYNNYK